MTRTIYLEDTYLLESESSILKIGNDEKGIFIILDQTIFYPQGGGQPADHGIIKNNSFTTNVIHVAQNNDEIKHYITPFDNMISTNAKICCLVDKERRLLNARYHTASHLLGNIVEIMYPQLKALKGHSFPGEAYVEFQGNYEIDAITVQNKINECIAQNAKIKIFTIDQISFEHQYYKVPYSVGENKEFRAMQIGDMLPIPCGGTHLSSVGEIEFLAIKKIKAKNNLLRISYEVT